MNRFKELFLLDPDVVFLNHGSFGATPRPVFEAYQGWQRLLERQPVQFLSREFNELMRESRNSLGNYIHGDADDLVYLPNATYGVNIIAHSMELKAGDEVLSTDHEYGACDNAWDFLCKKGGAFYKRQPIGLPVRSADEIIEQFWHGVTPHTKIIYLSHITSPTALKLPVEQICELARHNGIITIVDAAHSAGQCDLNVQKLGADFVFGNCHKWMLSPKGAGFLYARRDVHHLVKPLVVSWGYSSTTQTDGGSRFVDLLQWTGTRDPAATLSVPAAIQFMNENHWEIVRNSSHSLLYQAIKSICDLTGMAPLYPLDSDFYSQMGIAPLPDQLDANLIKRQLYEHYKIEVPIIQWQKHLFIRISVQAYNSSSDIDSLVDALAELLPDQTS